MQVQNLGELVPGDVLVLCKEAKVMIGMMAENNVAWPVHHSQRANYSAAEVPFCMNWVVQWNLDPHKDGGVAHNTLCRVSDTMIQTVHNETLNHQDLLCVGDWDCGDTKRRKGQCLEAMEWKPQ